MRALAGLALFMLAAAVPGQTKWLTFPNGATAFTLAESFQGWTPRQNEVLLLDATGKPALLGRDGVPIVDARGEHQFGDGTTVELCDAAGAKRFFPPLITVVDKDGGGKQLMDDADPPVAVALPEALAGRVLVVLTEMPAVDTSPAPTGGGSNQENKEEAPTLGQVLLKEVTKFIEPDGGGLSGSNVNIGGILSRAFEDPETVNSVLSTVLENSMIESSLLKGLDLGLVRLDEQDGGFGLDFTYARDVPVVDLSPSGDTERALRYTIHAEGLLATNRMDKANDYIDADVSLRFWQSSGGVIAPAESDKEELGTRLNAIEDRLVEYQTTEELFASADWAEFSSVMRDYLSRQVYFDFGIDGGIEANQAFTARQYTFGASASLDIKAWQSGSLLSWLNLFDHPAALARVVTGYDKEFRPRGATLPTVVVGLDYVEPDAGDPRAAFGDDSGYSRFRASASFRTPVTEFASETVHFNANYRFFQELDADQAVKSADLEDCGFVELSLTSSSGLFVSYSDGRLPLDTTNDQVYSLGWTVDFGGVKK